jgi:hypothetical protein
MDEIRDLYLQVDAGQIPRMISRRISDDHT